MKKANIKAGMTIFLLERNCYNPNDEKQLFVEMKVSNTKDGLEAKAVGNYKWESERSSFLISDIDDNTLETLPQFLFATKEEAKSQYDKEFEEWKSKLASKTKQEMINNFLTSWIGESFQPLREIEAIKDKIEKEFGIRPKY